MGQDDFKDRLSSVLDGFQSLLLEKNRRYGSSALRPIHCTYKGESADGILVRLDDKIARLQQNREEPRLNDIADIAGYCFLYMVAKGVKESDLTALID